MSLETIELWVKIIGGIIAASAALVAAFKAIAEWREANLHAKQGLEQRREELLQRKQEFRHKQAIFAREIIKEIFGDPRARAALRMLDWLYDEYTDEDGEKYEIRRSDIQNALRTEDLDISDKELFIRTRFESLYDHLEQLENLIEVGIVNFDDVETAFRYYLVRALRPEISHFGFLEYYDYQKATTFLNRFAGSKDTGKKRATKSKQSKVDNNI